MSDPLPPWFANEQERDNYAFSKGPQDLSTPDDAAMWLLNEVQSECVLRGRFLGDAETALLMTPFSDLEEDDKPVVMEAVNALVPITRHRMDRAKARGVPVVKVRRGHRVPQQWQDAYQKVYDANQPWVISFIVQTAMQKNPWAGERDLWKSK